jgi:hypothetical protein
VPHFESNRLLTTIEPLKVFGDIILAKGEMFMRVSSLVIVFLFACISVHSALAGEKEQSGCSATPSVSELFQKHPLARVFTAPNRQSRNVLDLSKKLNPLSSLSSSAALDLKGSPVCYVIDAYRVAREEGYSDSTMMVGHSTCTPSSKFRVEDSVESQTPISR